jgi:lipid II:glycine glycyltransferase (peptidoglycan interpeptide bridge formation enzyme)
MTVLRRRLPATPWSFFYIPRGPAVDYADREAVVFLRDALVHLGRRHHACFVRLDPPLPGGHRAEKSTLARYGFAFTADEALAGGTQPRAVWHLPLDRPLDDLLAGLAKDHRYFLRRAGRSGLTVREGTEADLPLFHGLLAGTARRKAFGVRSLQYFQGMWRQLGPGGPLGRGGHLRLFISECPDGPLAAVLLGVMGRRAWGLYQGTSDAHRNLGPSYYLIWEIITQLAAEGFTLFDLGGVPWKTSGDSGLEHFKAGFGGTRVEYIGDYDYVFLPTAYALWRLAFQARRKAMRARRIARNAAGKTVRAAGAVARAGLGAATKAARSLSLPTHRRPKPAGPPGGPAG